MNTKHSPIRSVLATLLLVFGLIYLILLIYTADSYQAREYNSELRDNVLQSNMRLDGKLWIFYEHPEKTDKLVLFYPGAKVDYHAYQPLCEQIANLGYDVALIKMPYNLAILDENRASFILSNLENQYKVVVGMGHSLGGTTMASWAKNAKKLDAIVYIAAYPGVDLSSLSIPSLQILGEKDGIVPADALDKSTAKHTTRYTKQTILGANHGHFGNYGEHDGDKEADIIQQLQ